jgi:hypothetical protein
MIYHEVESGYVTQLAVTDGRLIIGEENGNPGPRLTGAWSAVSAIRALSVTSAGGR